MDEVTRAMGLDPRIGGQFLKCRPRVWRVLPSQRYSGLLGLAERVGVDFGMLKEAERINKQRIDILLEKVKKALWVIKDKQIGVLGLAFKANTDDIRFAPAIEVIRRLLAEGATIRAYDPEAMDRSRSVLPNIQYGRDPHDVAQSADALLLLTEWEEFRKLDWNRIQQEMARPLILDARNMLRAAEMEALGFEYVSFGRPQPAPVMLTS